MRIPEPETLHRSFRIFCVCGGFGFPIGTASTKRIRLMGRCLVSNGIPFHVWHIGPSSFSENTRKSGHIDGISYEYLTPRVRRPRHRRTRILFYLWGCLQLALRLFRHRRGAVVYCYYQGDFINLWTLWLCRLLRIPVVQEACEWWSLSAYSSRFKHWMYDRIMFRLSDGALPVSRLIARRIRSLTHASYPMCRVPILTDPAENNIPSPLNCEDTAAPPTLLWCGMVDGYKRDLYFLMDGMAKLRSPAGRACRFQIVGPCSENMRKTLLSYAKNKRISAARIDLAGFVTDEELWRRCTSAQALLMPMWGDDRSCTRFPTKLGQYVAAGRPIVTVRIGELKYFLDDRTAMFYRPGDSDELARVLDRLLSEPGLGDHLAKRAAQTVLPMVDYRTNASRISQWFRQFQLRKDNA